MGKIHCYKDLCSSLAALGEMGKSASRAMQDFGNAFYLYCKNDVIATGKIALYALPNNKRKMCGIPLKRSRSYNRAKKNERRKNVKEKDTPIE